MSVALSRRSFLLASSVVGAGAALGCIQSATATQGRAALSLPAAIPPTRSWQWKDQEEELVVAQRPDFDIVTRQSPTCRVLRQRTRRVQPLVDLSIIASRMEATMLAAKGVGVAGPQVGLNLRIATLMLDYKSDKPRIQSFRNPFIIERSDDSVEGYEGCLSIPGVGGMVRRSSWVRVSHETLKGETLFEEAQGYNAVLWQHELDHLEGILYVDKLLGDLLPMDEVRRRREEMDKAKGSALFHLPDNDIMIA